MNFLYHIRKYFCKATFNLFCLILENNLQLIGKICINKNFNYCFILINTCTKLAREENFKGIYNIEVFNLILYRVYIQNVYITILDNLLKTIQA